MRSKHWGHAAVLTAGLAVAACGGGGGGDGQGTYDPDSVTQVLGDKVGVNGQIANLLPGTPPTPSGSASLKAEAPDSVPVAQAGTSVVVPLTVTADNALANLFAKVPGASAYFEVELPSTSAKSAGIAGGRGFAPRLGSSTVATVSKAETVLEFSVSLPDGLDAGRLCFELSVRDAGGLISNIDLACIDVQRPAPTAAPTSPPGGTGTAAACLNPEVFAVGTTVQSTFEETSPTGSSTTTESYTVTRETVFNGQAAVEVGFDDGFFDYLRVDEANARVLVFGSRDEFGTCTYEPPLEVPFGLDTGESRAQQTTQSCTDSETVQATVTTTYVGPERISVPAGTFDTCRLRQAFTVDGFTFALDTWIAVGSGVEVRLESDGFGGEFSEVLVGASINGQAVTGN